MEVTEENRVIVSSAAGAFNKIKFCVLCGKKVFNLFLQPTVLTISRH